LLRHEFPDYEYVSLEDLDVRQYALEDPRGFISDHPQRAILDEIQRVPTLFSYLQTHIDNAQTQGMYLLSGSQNWSLLKNISQSLAGRVGFLELLPFSLSELERTSNRLKTAQDWMLQGGYPRLITNNIDPASFFPGYVKTYVERDVRSEMLVNNLDTFGRFLKVVASRAGQLINYEDIGSELGIDYRTVKSWVSVLNSSYITFELEPYFTNFGKRITKTHKLYFVDTGLLCSLLNIRDLSVLRTHYMKGHIFENAVVSEFLKHKFHRTNSENLFFWRSNERMEIDLLREDSGNLQAFEIKSSQTPRSEYVSSLLSFAEIADIPLDQVKVIYGGDSSIKLKGVRFTPWNRL
jgi:predicted AAA+ superfamily ATPase